jgi:histidine triad (HIT) family protein
MSLQTTYDRDNVFAKIIRGDMPSVSVHDDERTMAFMDVFPQTEGHVLVIHKTAEATNLLDLDPEALNEVMATVQKVAKAVTKALSPDGLRIVQFNGEAAGQTVFHTHFHIIPVRKGRSLARHAEGMASTEELETTAKAIRDAI